MDSPTLPLSRRALLAGAGATGLALLVPGCRSAVNEENGGDTATPSRGGTLVLAASADAQPQVVLAPRAGNNSWSMLVYESLTRRDPRSHEPQPLLATDWQISEDGLTMELELRDDVIFHTGRPLTAEDVVFTFEQVADPVNASQVRFIVEQFDTVEPRGEHALTIRFKNPLSNVFDLFEVTPIVDRETWDEVADGTRLVGTGPFTWQQWRPGAQIDLVRFDDYRDPDRPYLDAVEMPILADSTAQVSALRSGRAQLGYGLITADALSLASDPQFEVDEYSGVIYPFGFDVTVAPFDDQRVRQAIGYAIDRERILEQVFGGVGTVTDLFWGVNEPGYDEEQAGHYQHDPDRAARMIEEAGAVGAEVPITLPTLPQNESIFEIVANNLEAIGLQPSAERLDVTDWDARQVEGDLGPAFLPLHGQLGFAAATLIRSLPTLREGNPSQFWSGEYEARQEDVSNARNEEERAAALTAMSSYLLDQAFCHVICHSAEVTVRASELQGVAYGTRAHVLLADAYLPA